MKNNLKKLENAYLENAYNVIKTIYFLNLNVLHFNIKKIWSMIFLNGFPFFENFENENNNLKILVFFISKTLTYSRENMDIRL